MTNLTTPPTSPSANDGNASTNAAIAPCDALIIDAYFARKVVTETNGATTVQLNRINTHVLGRVLYVVVDTWSVACGESVTISLLTDDTRLTGTSQQTLSVTNGTADVTSFTGRIGDTSALNDHNGTCAYTNLGDFTNKAIFKLALRPHARTDFDNWARHIDDAGKNLPSIRVEVSGALIVAFANLFREHLTLENKIVYEIQHGENPYNFLPMHTLNGHQVRKRISHIQNTFTNQVRYYFFNRIDNWHQICDVTQTSVRKRANGQTVPAVPAGYAHTANAPGGDAATNYYYNRPATPPDMTIQDPTWQYYRIVTTGHPGNTYGIKSYKLANPPDMIDLVPMPDNLNYDAETGANRVWATFGYDNTERRSSNPGCFAGFLGTLIQLGRRDIVCAGICFADATSYPSVTHPNGDSVDTLYLNTLAEEQLKVNAFRDHYFEPIRRGTGWKASLQGTVYTAFHEGHLHAENFDVARVVVLNPA